MYDIYQSTADDACRFALGRSGRRSLVVVGLNPSTATRDKSDPTAAKVERVARAHGYDAFVLVNLCPVRATYSRTLPATVDSRLLAANLRAIAEVVRAVEGVTLWAAWGAPILTRPFLFGAAVAIAEGVERFGPAWQHFGPLTVGGHPRHPSRLSYAWRFAPFDVAAYLEEIHSIAADSGLDAAAAGSRSLRPSRQKRKP
jgi:hypothetical protein